MKTTKYLTVPGCLLVLIMAGCSSLGPRSIDAGRSAYAEAISRTEDEQILLSIVKGRYGESASLLQVNAIAANIRFRVDTGLELGFNGDTGVPGENLITGGMAYEENPTITYSPVEGEQYLKQLMTPVPLDFLLLAMRSSTTRKNVFNLLVTRINGLRNPVFLTESLQEPDPGFARFVVLFTQLRRNGILELAGNGEEPGTFALLLRNDPKYAAEVAEFVSLLELSIPEGSPENIVLPIRLAINRDRSWSMAISTRSTFDLIELMRASVEVPAEHREAGWTIEFPPTGCRESVLKIQSSTSRPAHAARAVQYRGYWFFIDDADQKTKLAFNLLRSLWSIAISSNSDGHHNVPVLTIPVSQ